MNTKPLKAYEVQERQEGYSTIVFATNSATARREGAAELSIDWEDVDFCRRLPWADEYAGVKGGVPPLVCIDHGWWFQCAKCGCRINSDFEGWDKDGNFFDIKPIEERSLIYCSQSCKDERDDEVKCRKSAFEESKSQFKKTPRP